MADYASFFIQRSGSYRFGYREEHGAGRRDLQKELSDNQIKSQEEIARLDRNLQKELAERIAEPIKIHKKKQGKIIYAGKYQIASNFTGSTKQYIMDLLKGKKCSELMLIN